MPRRPALPRKVAAVVFLTAALMLPSFAHAQDDAVQRYLTAASRLYENLEYERALEQLKRARSLPGRSVDDDVSIALYEGIILADMGKKEESSAAFKEGLYLKPDAKLPVRVSPKVVNEFESVRTDVKKELAPILAKQEAEKKRKEEEAAKAAAAEAQAKAQREREEAAARQRAMDAAKSDAERARIAAEDKARREREARERELRESDRPEDKQKLLIVQNDPNQRPDYVPGTEKKVERGVPVAPFVLGGVALAAGGAGAFFGLQSKNQVQAARDAQFQDESVKQLDQASQSALIANVAFGVAGAAAIGAIITAFTSGGDELPARRVDVEGSGAGHNE